MRIVRNPIDLVADLIRRGFDWRVGADPREFQLTFLRNQVSIPIALRKLDSDFAEIKPSDLAALTVQESMKQNLAGFRDLGRSDRARVKIVYFDDFCEDPKREIVGLSKFLGVSPTLRTKRAVRRGNLPRGLPDREALLGSLEKEMTPIGISALDQAMVSYQEFREVSP